MMLGEDRQKLSSVVIPWVKYMYYVLPMVISIEPVVFQGKMIMLFQDGVHIFV